MVGYLYPWRDKMPVILDELKRRQLFAQQRHAEVQQRFQRVQAEMQQVQMELNTWNICGCS